MILDKVCPKGQFNHLNSCLPDNSIYRNYPDLNTDLIFYGGPVIIITLVWYVYIKYIFKKSKIIRIISLVVAVLLTIFVLNFILINYQSKLDRLLR